MVQMDVTVAEVNSTTFWRYPFNSICNPKQLTEYIIMDTDLILNKDRKKFPGQGAVSDKVFRYDNSTRINACSYRACLIDQATYCSMYWLMCGW
jgi:hypothetical protein